MAPESDQTPIEYRVLSLKMRGCEEIRLPLSGFQNKLSTRSNHNLSYPRRMLSTGGLPIELASVSRLNSLSMTARLERRVTIETYIQTMCMAGYNMKHISLRPWTLFKANLPSPAVKTLPILARVVARERRVTNIIFVYFFV